MFQSRSAPGGCASPQSISHRGLCAVRAPALMHMGPLILFNTANYPLTTPLPGPLCIPYRVPLPPPPCILYTWLPTNHPESHSIYGCLYTHPLRFPKKICVRLPAYAFKPALPLNTRFTEVFNCQRLFTTYVKRHAPSYIHFIHEFYWHCNCFPYANMQLSSRLQFFFRCDFHLLTIHSNCNKGDMESRYLTTHGTFYLLIDLNCWKFYIIRNFIKYLQIIALFNSWKYLPCFFFVNHHK